MSLSITASATTVVAVLLSLYSHPGHALTLAEFVAEVVQTNPEVLQEVHRHRQVMQERTIANKGWRPSVDLQASTGIYSTKSPATNQLRNDYDSTMAQVTVTQNLFNGYDTTYQIEQNRARLESAMYMVYDKADNLALEAVRAYLEALKQLRLFELAVANVESHERVFGQIRERTQSGVGLRSEEEQTAGRLAQARAGMYAQRNNLEDSMTVLHRLLGRYVHSSELQDTNLPKNLGGTLDEAIEKALTNHPALKLSHLNIDASQADYKRSNSSMLPRVDLQLQALMGDNLSGYTGPTDEYSVALNLRYNLYNGGADAAEQKRRISAVHENTEFANQVRREVIQALRLSWIANETLEEQIRYLTEHVERAGQTSSAYQEEVFLGHRNLIDLLDAKNEENIAMRSEVEAEYTLMSARYRIHEGVGSLFESMNLAVMVDEKGMKIIELELMQEDTLPTVADMDGDSQINRQDQCDNSLPDAKINRFGCVEREVIVENLNFIYDTARLVDESRKRLRLVIARIETMNPESVTIVAHADAKGEIDYNQKLSQRRAEAVRQRFVEAGFDAKILTADGRGESEPLADNMTDEGRAQNRRVEFVIMRPYAARETD
ncbi:MAG: TolC family outer membrane protein [Chromatiales bacterium]|nr:TolC family outer membrane protein [Chromatiales bacterium]